MNRLTVMLSALACGSATACATPADRISTTIEGYGVAQPQAVCMGQRLARDLTHTQMLELVRLVRAYHQENPDPGRLAPRDLIRVASQVRDPQVPIIVARTAVACGLIL